MTTLDHVDARLPATRRDLAVLGDVDLVGGLIVLDHVEKSGGRYVVQITISEIDKFVLDLEREQSKGMSFNFLSAFYNYIS